MKHATIATIATTTILASCASDRGIDPVIPYSAYPRAAEIRRLLAREAPLLCHDRRAPGVEVEGCVENLDAWNDRRARLEAELARFVPWPEQFDDVSVAAVP